MNINITKIPDLNFMRIRGFSRLETKELELKNGLEKIADGTIDIARKNRFFDGDLIRLKDGDILIYLDDDCDCFGKSFDKICSFLKKKTDKKIIVKTKKLDDDDYDRIRYFKEEDPYLAALKNSW